MTQFCRKAYLRIDIRAQADVVHTRYHWYDIFEASLVQSVVKTNAWSLWVSALWKTMLLRVQGPRCMASRFPSPYNSNNGSCAIHLQSQPTSSLSSDTNFSCKITSNNIIHTPTRETVRFFIVRRDSTRPGYTREETLGSHFVSYVSTKCIVDWGEISETRWRRPWFCTLNVISTPLETDKLNSSLLQSPTFL